MNRPTVMEIAKARAEAQLLLAGQPVGKPSEALRVLLRATAPFTKHEAIPVMTIHASKFGEFSNEPDDKQRAVAALSDEDPYDDSWDESIRAQWATLQHFFGGAS